MDAVNADDPSFAWQNYDGDGDGVVDNFTVIHAGMGQEGGRRPAGRLRHLVARVGDRLPHRLPGLRRGLNGCPDRDIYVREYSMDPENIDVGVIAEEFGHAAFGLPDIYTTDAQASPSNWTIMEAGSWNGIAGRHAARAVPAGLPLSGRLGQPGRARLHDTGLDHRVKVGQLSLRPKDTEQGIKINLPDQVIDTPNPLGTGKAWWSDRADLADFYLAHDFDLTGATAPIFSFASYWSFEAGL